MSKWDDKFISRTEKYKKSLEYIHCYISELEEENKEIKERAIYMAQRLHRVPDEAKYTLTQDYKVMLSSIDYLHHYSYELLKRIEKTKVLEESEKRFKTNQ